MAVGLCLYLLAPGPGAGRRSEWVSNKENAPGLFIRSLLSKSIPNALSGSCSRPVLPSLSEKPRKFIVHEGCHLATWLGLKSRSLYYRNSQRGHSRCQGNYQGPEQLLPPPSHNPLHPGHIHLNPFSHSHPQHPNSKMRAFDLVLTYKDLSDLFRELKSFGILII